MSDLLLKACPGTPDWPTVAPGESDLALTPVQCIGGPGGEFHDGIQGFGPHHDGCSSVPRHHQGLVPVDQRSGKGRGEWRLSVIPTPHPDPARI